MSSRISRLQRLLPDDMEAVLITSPINRGYYTNFHSSVGVLLVTKESSSFIIDSRYFELAEKNITDCRVVLKDVSNEYGQLLELLKEYNVKNAGIESKNLTVYEWEQMSSAFPGVKIYTDNRLSAIIANQRAIKEPGEIESMKAAQRIADKAFTHLLSYISIGKTEAQIEEELERFCRANGSGAMAFGSTVASGENSSSPHSEPGDRVIQAGDFITLDYGCTVNGYCSDMTRTVAIGPVSEQQRRCYDTVLAAQEASFQVIKDGVECVMVDKAARDVIDAVPEYKGTFIHALGHSIGLECHETPMCSRFSKETLAAGMVTSVEPGIYLPGQFGVRIEDCVIVTEDGCENLCTSTKELIVL